jgi:hypothetical protein
MLQPALASLFAEKQAQALVLHLDCMLQHRSSCTEWILNRSVVSVGSGDPSLLCLRLFRWRTAMVNARLVDHSAVRSYQVLRGFGQQDPSDFARHTV